MKTKQGQNGVDPLVVPSVVGVDVGGLQDSAVVSFVSSWTEFTQLLLVAVYGCTISSAGYSLGT